MASFDGGVFNRGSLLKKVSRSLSTPQQIPSGGVNPDSTGQSHDLAAMLLAAQFAEWQKTFKPIEILAAKQLSFENPEVLTNALEGAENVARQGSSSIQGAYSRQLSGVGIAPTVQQKMATDRLFNLSEAASVASAQNIARQNIRTQDEQILLGATPNPNVVKGTIQ